MNWKKGGEIPLIASKRKRQWIRKKQQLSVKTDIFSSTISVYSRSCPVFFRETRLVSRETERKIVPCEGILLSLCRSYYQVFSQTFFFLAVTPVVESFPDGTSGKEPACQCRRYKRCKFDPWGGKIPQRRAWQPTPVVLLENAMDKQRSLAGSSSWNHKESGTTEVTEHTHTCNISTEPWPLNRQGRPSSKVFLIKICALLFRHNAIAYFIDYSIA